MLYVKASHLVLGECLQPNLAFINIYNYILTYFIAHPVSVQAGPRSASSSPLRLSRVVGGQPPPQGWTISPRVWSQVLFHIP